MSDGRQHQPQALAGELDLIRAGAASFYWLDQAERDVLRARIAKLAVMYEQCADPVLAWRCGMVTDLLPSLRARLGGPFVPLPEILAPQARSSARL